MTRRELLSSPSHIPFQAAKYWRQWLERKVLEGLPSTPGRKGQAARRLCASVISALSNAWLEYRVLGAATR